MSLSRGIQTYKKFYAPLKVAFFCVCTLLIFFGRPQLLNDIKVTQQTTSVTYPTSTEPLSTSSTQPKPQTTTIPILVYHKLSPVGFVPKKESDKNYNIYQDVFEAQMKYLQQEGYTPLLVRDILLKKKMGELPEKPIAITFDDGWKSQYDIALPILLAFHLPATFYIYTDVVGDRAFMNINDLKTLITLGMEIGGHTEHHPMLSRVYQPKLKSELLGSKEYLEEKLSTKITDFAYPYGDYSTSTIQALIAYGYESARTSRHDIHNTLKDPYTLNALYAPYTLAGLKKILSSQ